MFKRSLGFLLLSFVIIVFGIFSVNAEAAGKKSYTVKIGSMLNVSEGGEGVTFSSSKPSIACVDINGNVIGKKVGKAVIYRKVNGSKKKLATVKVKKRARRPKLIPVSASEVTVSKDANTVTNKSSSGSVKKVVLVYTAPDVMGVEYTKEAYDIEPKSTAELSDYSPMVSKTDNLELVRVEVYSGKALHIYNISDNKYVYKWGTEDTKAPKITGWVKKKSYSGHGDTYRTYYSDRRNSYSFKEHVSATDDRDGKVKVTVDTSKINWKKTGKYKIYYHAEDEAGNKATSWAKVQVIVPGSAEAAADRILASITKKSWSNEKKARHIYSYVKGHMSYVHNASHPNWRSSGLNGFRYHSGDCYTYYSTSRLLLTRAGIPNVMINRFPANPARHYWNLVYVHGGWYHFDTTPRARDRRFCLWTDAQLRGYSTDYTFRFNHKLYPKRAKKRIS